MTILRPVLSRRPLVGPLLAMALWAAAGQAAALAPGDPAPDFELPGWQQRVQLSAWRGQFVYLDFWASWCGPCKQSFPWMNGLQTRFGAQGLTVLAVGLDSHIEDAQRFLAETSPRFAVAFDTQGVTPRQYAVKGMPTSLLIGPDGKVLWVHRGFHPDERAELEALIARQIDPRKSPP